MSRTKKARMLGVVAAFATVLPAIVLSFWIALGTFWWCPLGGCPLATTQEQLALLTNVLGVSILMVIFSLVLQFLFLLIARTFFDKTTVVDAFLAVRLPFLGWYDDLMRKWIDLLWR
jgi:hypothetical protein